MRTDITRWEQYEIIEGYISAMLWANTYGFEPEPDQPGGSLESVDAFYGEHGELSDEARTTLEQDVFDFLTPQVVRLMTGVFQRASEGYTLSSFGHDFALTRNGHGAGFWDRGLGMVGEALTQISKPYGTRSLISDGERIEIFE